MFTNFENMRSIPDSKVYFFSENVKVNLKDRKKLKVFLEKIFRLEMKKLNSLICIFCDDKKLLQINKKFLGHDDYTDVISFDLSDSELIQGEIYISYERIRDNARQLKVTIKEELIRVIIHGVLHLCNYDDKSVKNKNIMRDKEDNYINLLNKFCLFT